jgi:hypothetical protein
MTRIECIGDQSLEANGAGVSDGRLNLATKFAKLYLTCIWIGVRSVTTETTAKLFAAQNAVPSGRYPYGSSRLFGRSAVTRNRLDGHVLLRSVCPSGAGCLHLDAASLMQHAEQSFRSLLAMPWCRAHVENGEGRQIEVFGPIPMWDCLEPRLPLSPGVGLT